MSWRILGISWEVWRNTKLKKRRKGDKTFYLVWWKGYDSENDSWQTAWDLQNAPDIICEWHHQLRWPNRMTALIVSCVTSSTDVFSTVIHHLVSNSSCSIQIKMSSSMTAPNARKPVHKSTHRSLVVGNSQKVTQTCVGSLTEPWESWLHLQLGI